VDQPELGHPVAPELGREGGPVPLDPGPVAVGARGRVGGPVEPGGRGQRGLGQLGHLAIAPGQAPGRVGQGCPLGGDGRCLGRAHGGVDAPGQGGAGRRAGVPQLRGERAELAGRAGQGVGRVGDEDRSGLPRGGRGEGQGGRGHGQDQDGAEDEQGPGHQARTVTAGAVRHGGCSCERGRDGSADGVGPQIMHVAKRIYQRFVATCMKGVQILLLRTDLHCA
jgi:hypothetical protein